MESHPEHQEVQEHQHAANEKLSPKGIAAMQGEPAAHKIEPAAPKPEPAAPKPEPAAPEPAAPEPATPPPPAFGEKGMADRIEKKDIVEREYYPSVSGEKGF